MKRKRKAQKRHKTWQLQEAKSQFSRLVDEVIEDGYHTITRNGEPVVVVISQREFEERIKPKDSIIDFFLRSPYPDYDLDLTRDKDPGREFDL
jgi:prevent-host-death family protein